MTPWILEYSFNMYWLATVRFIHMGITVSVPKCKLLAIILYIYRWDSALVAQAGHEFRLNGVSFTNLCFQCLCGLSVFMSSLQWMNDLNPGGSVSGQLVRVIYVTWMLLPLQWHISSSNFFTTLVSFSENISNLCHCSNISSFGMQDARLNTANWTNVPVTNHFTPFSPKFVQLLTPIYQPDLIYHMTSTS